MKQKQQVIHIHGGEPFEKYEDYLENLKTGRFEIQLEDSKKWYKNLRSFFDLTNYEVITPSMPCPENAKYSEWKIWFERHIEFVHDDVILTGHSLGGNFLAKWLSENELPVTIKQLHLIAASHSDFEDDFKLEIFPNKFFENDIGQIHIYHSKDDAVVPISESEKYHELLPDSIFHIFEDRFHFLDETFPELFENIKNADK